MTRIAHLADLHLGYNLLHRLTPTGQNQREADFQRAALRAADYLINEAQVDLVLLAGDTLHDTRISNTGLDGAIEFFERLQKAGLPVVVIGGNHDEASSPGRFNALHILRRAGVGLYLEQTHVDIAGVRIHTMPFQVLARWLRGRGEVVPFTFAADQPNVLLGHAYAGAEGMPAPPEEVFLPADWVDDPRFDLVCLGHIHRHMQISDRAFYAGSLERRDFGERNERPGFWIHELENGALQHSESVFVDELGVPYTPRPMIQLEVEGRALPSDELSAHVMDLIANTDLNGAICRLVVTNVSAEMDRSRTRSAWKRAFRDAGGFYLDIVTHTRRVSELLDVQFAAPPVNIAVAFEEYLAGQSYASDDERREILALGAEIMVVAHDKILSLDAD